MNARWKKSDDFSKSWQMPESMRNWRDQKQPPWPPEEVLPTDNFILTLKCYWTADLPTYKNQISIVLCHKGCGNFLTETDIDTRKADCFFFSQRSSQSHPIQKCVKSKQVHAVSMVAEVANFSLS